MNVNELQQWSRHVDLIMWTVVTLLTGGNGALYIYCFKNFHPWLCALGVILTILMAYFVASFRSHRRTIHAKLRILDQEAYNVACNPSKLKQWYAILVVLALFAFSWFHLMDAHYSDLRWLWILLGTTCFGVCALFVAKEQYFSNTDV
jgi:hypothetical protein